MMRENQNTQTCRFVRVYATGKVATKKGYRDVEVYGYIEKWGWKFIVHRDIKQPQYYTISEASTGYQLKDETYYEVEDAFYFAESIINEKRFYFATRVGDILVCTQRNLLKRNTELTSLGLDVALW